MKKGNKYSIGLASEPAVFPNDGGWSLIRFPSFSVSVRPIVDEYNVWENPLHIMALEDCPEPVPNRDEIVYRDPTGEGECRLITSFQRLA